MTAMEMKKLQVEYKRVNASKEEQELRILECEEQIQRLKTSIAASVKREEELKALIADAKVD